MDMSYTPELSSAALSEFVRANVKADLRTVPGIGEKSVEKLKAVGITTTFELISQFLLLKGHNVDYAEHCDAFWRWLKNAQIDSRRSEIVRSIAEKVFTVFPGLYEAAFDLVIIGDLDIVYRGLKYTFHERLHALYDEIVTFTVSKCRCVWTSASILPIDSFVANFAKTNHIAPTIAIIGHSFDGKVVLTKDVDIPHDTAIFGSILDARIIFYTCVDTLVSHPNQSDRVFYNYIASFYLKLCPSLDDGKCKEMDSIQLGVPLDSLSHELIPSQNSFVFHDLVTIEKGK